jgi:HlyD family secretion protein
MKKWFSGRIGWILLVVVAALGAGGYYLYNTYWQPSTVTAEEPALQTAVAQRGDLTVFASAAGVVIPNAEIGVGFEESGTLIELLVEVGDQVQEGQILARLQTDQTEEDIALLVAQAEMNVLKVQIDLDEIYESADMDTALALQAVETAEQALEELYNVDLKQAEALEAIAEAEDNLKEVEREYNNVRSTASQTVIDAAHADMILKEEKLKEAKDRFNEYADKRDTNLTKANLQLILTAAQQDYDDAVIYYNSVTSTGSELDKAVTAAKLATAQAELANAQHEWELIKNGPSPGEIAIAEATLADAEAEWELLKEGPDPDEIAIAEAELANAEAELAEVQEEKAEHELLAPMDGTIMSIDASVGEKISTGSIIQLADLSLPLLEIYLDETDLNNVGIGYEIEVVFDALPEEIFIGHVIQIDPSLQSVSGVQAVRVLAQLDPESFSKPQYLPVGLNASVDVIGGRAENVVLIPVEALREISPGEYAVFRMENGEPKLRVVTIGLMDYTSEAGDTVTTGIIETN